MLAGTITGTGRAPHAGRGGAARRAGAALTPDAVSARARAGMACEFRGHCVKRTAVKSTKAVRTRVQESHQTCARAADPAHGNRRSQTPEAFPTNIYGPVSVLVMRTTGANK
eukprot:scaffold40220_cov47-Phaeocystis_antarctica.AAC.3